METVLRTVQYEVHDGGENDMAVDCQGRQFHIHEISAKILAKIRDEVFAVPAP